MYSDYDTITAVTRMPSDDDMRKLSAEIDLRIEFRSMLPHQQLFLGRQISDETTLTSFHPASEEEIRRPILTSPSNRGCELDPIPTHLLKVCVDVLVTPITLLVNKSLAEGFSPISFQEGPRHPCTKEKLTP